MTGSALLARIQKTVPVRRGVYRYVVWKGDLLNTLDPSIVPLTTTPRSSSGSREWAFSRTERLSISRSGRRHSEARSRLMPSPPPASS